MTCHRHPKAASAVRMVDGVLVSECWACEVQHAKKRQPVKVGDILPTLVRRKT